MPDLRPLAALVDMAVPERVLVTGSHPENASDLDVLVRHRAAAALQQALPAAGFTRWGGGWMRLSGCLAAVVDLEPAWTWRLPDAEICALFDQGDPLDGLARVVEPAPHHALLILARRLAANEGRLDHRRLARGRRALVRQPTALEAAHRAASAWSCAGALEVLASLLEGRQPSRQQVRAHLRGDRALVPSPARSAVRRVLRRPAGRGAVVSLSGLDGAGKSTQAQALVVVLRSLGYDATTVWARISYGHVLVWLAAPVKGAARLAGLGVPTTGTAVSATAVSEPSPPSGPATAIEPPPRLSSTTLWSLMVVLVYVVSARAVTRLHLRKGRIVVTDRYVLDSAVHLLDRYGVRTQLRLHLRLVDLLLPRPVAAYLLDVSAEEAYRRKPEQFDVARLARQRTLYLAQAALRGIEVVDGAAPIEMLCEKLVRRTLEALPTSAPTSMQQESHAGPA